MNSLNTAYFKPVGNSDNRYTARYYTYVLFSCFNNTQLFAISFITGSKNPRVIDEKSECIIVFTNLCARETIYVIVNGETIELKPRVSLAHHEKLSDSQTPQEYPIAVSDNVARTHVFQRTEFKVTDEIAPQPMKLTPADFMALDDATAQTIAGALSVAGSKKSITSRNRIADVALESLFDNPRSCGIAHNVSLPSRRRPPTSRLRYSNTSDPADIPKTVLVSFTLTSE